MLEFPLPIPISMNELINSLLFSLSITGPICLMLLLGIALRRTQMMNEGFIDGASKLVFNVALPMLLFTSIAQTDFSQMASPSLILYGIGATLVAFVLLELLASRLTSDKRLRGILVQGAFRANMGIIGLAYVNNAYGSQGVASVAMYVACLTILFNILAVVTLNRSLSQDKGLQLGKILKDIAQNPLIIGIVAALPFAASDWQVPAVLMKTGHYLAQMTLPVALLCTGATLSLKRGQEETGLLPSRSIAAAAGHSRPDHPGRLPSGLSRGRADHAVSDQRLPHRRRQLCHGACHGGQRRAGSQHYRRHHARLPAEYQPGGRPVEGAGLVLAADGCNRQAAALLWTNLNCLITSYV
jgi:malonate transporter and related proteins